MSQDGKDMVKLKIYGFRWKGSCFIVSYFCLNWNGQKTQLRVHVLKLAILLTFRDILVACWEIGSLPEQVKQKENLCDHNIQLKNLTMFKKEHSGSFFVRNWHLRSFCNFLLLILTLWLSTALIQVLISPSLDTTCDVIKLNVTSYSWYADSRARMDLSAQQTALGIDSILT